MKIVLHSVMQVSIPFRSMISLLICCVLIGGHATASEEVVWGKVISQTNGTGITKLEIQKRPAADELVLPATLPEISAAYILKNQTREFLTWRVGEGDRQVHLDIPQKRAADLPMNILLESGDKSGQYTEGRIVFFASDARLSGNRLKLDQVHHRIGPWSDSGEDAASWDFKPTRWGMYDVEVSYASEKNNRAEWQVEIAGANITATVPGTGDANRFGVITAGRVYLEKSDPFTVRVSSKVLKSDSKVFFKAVTLRPAPEGGAVIQQASGPVSLHASNAVTHSVMMRYEPAEKKRCLGYWVNPADWAEWTFELIKPGRYEVELWQGCGKGQGGSDVQVKLNGEKLQFVVEETGHFQNFIPRRIGTAKFDAAGRYSLEVRPLNKKAGAVMDIQQIKLIPVDKL